MTDLEAVGDLHLATVVINVQDMARAVDPDGNELCVIDHAGQ